MCCTGNQGGNRHGSVIAHGQTNPTKSLPWIQHPKSAEVSLRYLVTGKDTRGRLSFHHVRIEAGCAIGDHTDAGRVETHDVIAGSGTRTLESSVIPYTPGVVGIMPAGQVHRPGAGDGGLFLPATFAPPLV